MYVRHVKVLYKVSRHIHIQYIHASHVCWMLRLHGSSLLLPGINLRKYRKKIGITVTEADLEQIKPRPYSGAKKTDPSTRYKHDFVLIH